MGLLDGLKALFGGGQPSTPQPSRPGSRSPSPSQHPTENFEGLSLRSAVQNDLGRLNNEVRSLGDLAVHYVLTGENPQTPAIVAEEEAGRDIFANGGQNHERGGPTRMRQYVLAQRLSDDPDIIFRYSEVLAACLKARPSPYRPPDGMSLVFFAYALNVSAGTGFIRGTTPEQAETFKANFTHEALLDLLRRTGGTAADLITFLFEAAARHNPGPGVDLRRYIDANALILAHPEAVNESAPRLGVIGRLALLDVVLAANTPLEEPFLSFVMDMAGTNLKPVRERAQAALAKLDKAAIEPLAVARLKAGDATMREAMASLLGRMGTESAAAALAEHLPGERAASVRAVIETRQAAFALRSDAGPDDGTAYTALDGTRIEIPPLRPFRPFTGEPLSDADQAEVQEIFERLSERWAAQEAERLAKYKKRNAPASAAA